MVASLWSRVLKHHKVTQIEEGRKDQGKITPASLNPTSIYLINDTSTTEKEKFHGDQSRIYRFNIVGKDFTALKMKSTT